MKRFFFSILAISLLCISGTLQAQETLIVRFGADAIASIEGTEKLEILQYQNLNGYAIQDLNGQKDISGYPDALEVEPIGEDTPPLTESQIENGFELFAYDFPTSPSDNRYYRVGDSGKLLTVYSISAVKREFEQSNNTGE